MIIKNEVKFMDLSYEDKRRKYRQYAVQNGFAYEMKLFIMDEISQGLPKEILTGIEIDQYLSNLLVDGYLAFERVFDSKGEKIIDYQSIDPTTLIIGSDSDNKQVWIQYNDNPKMKRFLTEDQILYVIYPIIDANDSLIGQLYTKQIKLYNHEKLNDFMISYIVKKVRIQLIDIIKQEKEFFKK